MGGAPHVHGGAQRGAGTRDGETLGREVNPARTDVWHQIHPVVHDHDGPVGDEPGGEKDQPSAGRLATAEMERNPPRLGKRARARLEVFEAEE